MTLRRRRGPCWFLNYTFSLGLGETKKLNCIIDSQLGQTKLLPWGIVVQQKRVIELVPCEEGSRCCRTTESKVTHLNNATRAHTDSQFKDLWSIGMESGSGSLDLNPFLHEINMHKYVSYDVCIAQGKYCMLLMRTQKKKPKTCNYHKKIPQLALSIHKPKNC